MPFFSVIIPLYNKQNHIKHTLNSVLNQSFKDFEVIIVNDGSTDKSLREVNLVIDPRISIYSIKNSGVSYARNFAIKKAKGQYLSLLDADDLWHANHLQEHLHSIKMFPNGSLFCNAYQIKLSKSNTINAIYNIENQKTPTIINDYFLASMIHPIAWTSAIVLDKKVFIDLKAFNPNYTTGEDLDLIIRVALKKTIVFNPKITSCYDKTIPTSLSKQDYFENRSKVFFSFQNEERKNKSLKKYLNLNKYSLAMLCKLNKNKPTFKKLYSKIDKTLLNNKQKILLELPHIFLIIIKKIHLFLIKKNIYISSYK